MHIIVLEKYPSSQRGGQERSLVDVTRQLAQRGHRITLLYGSPGDLLPQYKLFCDRMIPVKDFAILRSWQSPFWLGADLLRVWYELRVKSQAKLQAQSSVEPNIESQSEATIVYINQPYDVPFASILSWLKNVPLVCHLRLPSPVDFGLQRRLTVGRVKQFISVSAANRQGWTHQVKAPIAVVHNGVIPDRYARQQSVVDLRQTWQIPQDDRVICYVGRLDQMKGLGTLCSAFAKILETHPHSQLLIAGKPLQDKASYQTELEQRCVELGIHDRVRFLGHIDRTIEVFHLSDISVVPSQWAEPCARAIIESLMAGTPVVASKVGGNVELLTGEFSSGLFEARDVDDLARTIRSRLNWRQDDPTLGDRTQDYAQQRFNLSDKVDAIEQVLLQVAPPIPVKGDLHVA